MEVVRHQAVGRQPAPGWISEASTRVDLGGVLLLTPRRDKQNDCVKRLPTRLLRRLCVGIARG